MPDKKIFFAPAKLNIFLKIIGKRNDGYHLIRSGITFINLFDKIEIEKSDTTRINYQGTFKPKNKKYDDCIIWKTLNFLKLSNHNFNITVTKNIPVQGGFGSASTNAATLIKGLTLMKVIKQRKPSDYISLGSDIPCFLLQKNCVIMGVGEIIHLYPFPKYYFLLVKPNFTNSTREMYNKLNFKETSSLNLKNEKFELSDKDSGNDFETIVFKNNSDFKDIFVYLDNQDKTIFTRLTGTGSCFYAAFEKKEYALKAQKIFQSKYNHLWTHVCENNTIIS